MYVHPDVHLHVAYPVCNMFTLTDTGCVPCLNSSPATGCGDPALPHSAHLPGCDGFCWQSPLPLALTVCVFCPSQMGYGLDGLMGLNCNLWNFVPLALAM